MADNPRPSEEAQRHLIRAVAELQQLDGRRRKAAIREALYFTTLALHEIQDIPTKAT